MEKDEPQKKLVIPFSTPALLFTYASMELIATKLGQL
jgi:hypothetical protein